MHSIFCLLVLAGLPVTGVVGQAQDTIGRPLAWAIVIPQRWVGV